MVYFSSRGSNNGAKANIRTKTTGEFPLPSASGNGNVMRKKDGPCFQHVAPGAWLRRIQVRGRSVTPTAQPRVEGGLVAGVRGFSALSRDGAPCSVSPSEHPSPLRRLRARPQRLPHSSSGFLLGPSPNSVPHVPTHGRGRNDRSSWDPRSAAQVAVVVGRCGGELAGQTER